jgi:4-hydroxy-tetrahydrodipicolinate synthase
MFSAKNRRITKYSGAMTALVTPFDQMGDVDHTVFRKLLNHQVENGISGLVIGGTTGESATLGHDEILDLIAIAASEVGSRALVIAGCGSNSTSRAIHQTRDARDRGADAGLSVVPYYNRPSQEGLFEHFSAIASEAELPIILYNVPGRTGTNLEADTVARLAENPVIVGVKEASGNLKQVEEILSMCPSDFSVLSGEDGLTCEIIGLGGSGVISVTSNILPARVSDLIDALLDLRLEEALEIHRTLTPLNQALFIDTNPVPVKEALDILGLCVGRPRLPLVPLDRKKRDALSIVLQDYEEEYRRGWDSLSESEGE